MTSQSLTSDQSVPSAPSTSSGGGIRGFFIRSENARGYALLAPTLILLFLAMVIPVVMLVARSFWTQSGMVQTADFSFVNYEMFFAKPIYWAVLKKSLYISGAVTIATLLLAYPAAYFVAFKVKKNKLIWLILITVPFWTSYLLRVFAWKLMLGYNGVVNSGLIGIGIIDEPLGFLLHNVNAVVLTLAHAWAAFAILPIYVSLEKIDKSLLEAAADLGEGPIRSFIRVTLPLSMPGVIAASLLVFIPTVGDYVTPKLVGGSGGIMIGNLVQNMFGRGNNWPMGSAIAVVMMITITLVVCVYLWLISQAKKRSS